MNTHTFDEDFRVRCLARKMVAKKDKGYGRAVFEMMKMQLTNQRYNLRMPLWTR